MVPERFSRSAMLIGEEGVARLAKARVAVFGLGGVGGATVEALARAGVGALDLVDHDVVSVTDCNRQLLATEDNIGRPKTEVAKERILSINPDCRVTLYPFFYLPETKDGFSFSSVDYVADAIDTVTAKLLLIEEAKRAGVPVISAMGAGNKLDPAAFRVADIYDTSVCPLAKVMRKECRARGIESLKVVYSEEPPVQPEETAEETSRRSLPGSVSFVPPVAGYILAGEIIKDLLRQ